VNKTVVFGADVLVFVISIYLFFEGSHFMANIPQAVLDRSPVLEGLTLRGRGKVRDSYDVLGSTMLVVATDRCSIFDFVLNTLIPQKGEVLTALNHFWVTEVLGDLCQTDLLFCGAQIDGKLPGHLSGDTGLQKRSTVVSLLPAPDVEDIVRIILTGSGWESYQKTQQICGHKLPKGLTNGSMLPYPIYTPTTKADVGHDEHITADSVVAKYGFLRERISLQVAGLMASHAATRGLIMADTKFEFSVDPFTKKPVLIDEKGTPDSSRFVDRIAWEKALKKGQFPPSLDKQYVREWGKKLGINTRSPENSADVEYVHSLAVPDDVVKMTTLIYRYIFWRLTGRKLETYQRDTLGINVNMPKLHVEVLIGSKNDEAQLEFGLEKLKQSGHSYNVSVMSCHRNADKLPGFTAGILSKADRVIACAGKAAALPGIVKSLLSMNGRSDIPVIGVALKGETAEDDRDATGSIKGLPGQPVELNSNGEAYFASAGFTKVCLSASVDEFLPKHVEAKPAEIGILTSA
jgi:phosphoribosylaminoimidazole-succinocarboxamide synthase